MFIQNAPIISRTVRTALAEKLRDAILLGEYIPGQNLRLEEIAKRFNVSTTPVREALSDLADEGLVTIFPHRGASVTKLSPEELQDIYEIRATLEAMAARLAVPCMNAEILTSLYSIVEQMDSHPGELVTLVKLNHDFHLTLYNASGRHHLCELIKTLRYRTQHYLHAYISDLGGMPQAQFEHKAVLRSCTRGEAEEAATSIYNHVTKVGRSLIEFVRMQDISVTLPR